ncbi:hypothetical protein STRDD11_01261 [Streptococcus sp. DD11]|uniref:MmcQ/YjbR family DNA-binding protein n=1 Tax=Streptococcus sp. DD11 TaxID=1777879 RepID=UPI000794E9EC|nr:MmcQ/YjbR family DNA-binding protein [Streptococcus sp. DD11]KXT83839.1 hypothetical protein STRDD11_01261 [Streptococcus sp. DD11]
MLDIFEKYKADRERLLAYGFEQDGSSCRYRQEIMDGDFELLLIWQQTSLDYQVFDLETGDEYRQVKMESMTGEFVGQVREACQQALLEIRRQCFIEIGFLYEQSQRLRDYVAETYQGQLEYLWEKSDRKSRTHAGVFRHQDSKKWYGAFLTTDWSKFEKDRSGSIEVLNVKNNQVAELTRQAGIYPAFHMNKKYWLSLPLDGTLSDRQIFDLLDTSFELTKRK